MTSHTGERSESSYTIQDSRRATTDDGCAATRRCRKGELFDLPTKHNGCYYQQPRGKMSRCLVDTESSPVVWVSRTWGNNNTHEGQKGTSCNMQGLRVGCGQVVHVFKWLEEFEIIKMIIDCT